MYNLIMISYLTGKPTFDLDGTLVLDVRDVGYRVFVTPATLTWALMQETVSLWVHTLVRETSMDLYGFETKNELYFFEKLLDVSGIGPKSALGIISLASTDTLYQAIVNQNLAFLTSVPGIGKKTAERMCVELKDKLKESQHTIKKWRDHLVEQNVVNVINGRLSMTLSFISPYDSLVTCMADDMTQIKLKSDPKTKQLMDKLSSYNNMSLLPLVAELSSKLEVLEKKLD